MKGLSCLLVSGCLLAGCAAEKKQEVQRVSDMAYATITDSVLTDMPGSLRATDGLVCWQDARATENFIHVVDIASGKEVCRFGNKGNGPDDFVAPLLSASQGVFYLDDFQKGVGHAYTVGKDGSCRAEKGRLEKDPEATMAVHAGDAATITLTPGLDSPFKVSADGKSEACGKFPLAEKCTNAFYVNQGNLAYNAKRRTLVYNCLSLPYLAAYTLKDGKLTLDKEVAGETSYTVQEGKLVRDEQSKRGAMELALTRKRVVTLDRDVTAEGERPANVSPRDPAMLPRSLFVHDYDLNLTHILNMPFPLVRICGDAQTDNVYAVGLNPEYTLVKIDLSGL